MTPETIKARLWCAEPDKHPLWPYFCREMSTRDYGADSLNQAWGFFRAGWAAHERFASAGGA